jgi:hypothetical protein
VFNSEILENPFSFSFLPFVCVECVHVCCNQSSINLHTRANKANILHHQRQMKLILFILLAFLIAGGFALADRSTLRTQLRQEMMRGQGMLQGAAPFGTKCKLKDPCDKGLYCVQYGCYRGPCRTCRPVVLDRSTPSVVWFEPIKLLPASTAEKKATTTTLGTMSFIFAHDAITVYLTHQETAKKQVPNLKGKLQKGACILGCALKAAAALAVTQQSSPVVWNPILLYGGSIAASDATNFVTKGAMDQLIEALDKPIAPAIFGMGHRLSKHLAKTQSGKSISDILNCGARAFDTRLYTLATKDGGEVYFSHDTAIVLKSFGTVMKDFQDWQTAGTPANQEDDANLVLIIVTKCQHVKSAVECGETAVKQFELAGIPVLSAKEAAGMLYSKALTYARKGVNGKGIGGVGFFPYRQISLTFSPSPQGVVGNSYHF